MDPPTSSGLIRQIVSIKLLTFSYPAVNLTRAFIQGLYPGMESQPGMNRGKPTRSKFTP